MRNRNPAFGRPDGLLIDLDNTFYPYRRPHERASEAVRVKACATLGLEPEAFDKALGEARFQVKEKLEGTASGHSRLLYYSRLCELLGLRTQPALALGWEQHYWREFLRQIELRPGARDFLGECRQAGVPIAVVTDLTTAIQYRKLVFLGIEELVDYVVCSEETGHDKPHPSMFRAACSKLAVDGSRVWMVGDDPVCDIGGAKAALGCTAIQVVLEPGSVAKSPDADAVVGSFDELRACLRRAG